MARESLITNQVEIAAAYRRMQLWRNNNGACEDATGRVIRYGLGNVSKEQNEKIKSSDFIGITPVLITPDMVGSVVGVFTAFEMKASDWKFSVKDKRAVAQLKFIDIVKEVGGFAGFVQTIDDMNRIIGHGQ